MPEEESLSDAFWAVGHLLRRLSREALAPWDLPPSYARALRVLAHHDGLRLSALAEHLRVAPRSATDLADGLEERALARRRPDPEDRRSIRLDLTEQGAELLEHLQAARGVETEHFFGRLSTADRTTLARILRELRE